MVKNYLRILFRNFLKRKVYSAINLLGLATGIAVCLLLVLYLQGEFGYDQFHPHAKHIYRLALERKYPNRSTLFGAIPASIGSTVQKEYPEVLQSVRLESIGRMGISVISGSRHFEEKNVVMADSNFFEIFQEEALAGDPKAALHSANTIVLNEHTAIKYFGSAQKAIGQTLNFEGNKGYTIGGVIKDWPEKTHLTFDILISTLNNNDINYPNFYDLHYFTYLLLNDHADVKALEAKLPGIVTKYVAPTIPKGFGISYEEFIKEGNGYRYFLQPLTDIHLNSTLDDELSPVGSMRVVYLFILVAVFILFLACINFINLSTALSLDRAREVGVRKVLGSEKRQLVSQFLSESILFSLVSSLLALGITYLLTPVMNHLTGGHVQFSWLLQPLGLMGILGFAVLVGCIAGLYPALVLSSFEPILVLKGRMKSTRAGLALRNGLVVFQFAISIILITCTLIIYKQMNYVMGDQLGFKKDHVLYISTMWHLREHEQTFIQQVNALPGVEATCLGEIPGTPSIASCSMNAVDNQVARTEKTIFVGDQYAQLFGLELKKGRFFSKDFPTDSFGLVLNERAVKDFDLKNPIGARIICNELNFNPWPYDSAAPKTVYTVVGVVKDYHFQSLHQEISPLIMANAAKFGSGTFSVRVRGSELLGVQQKMEQLWAGYDPDHTIRMRLLDQGLADQYQLELNTQRLFSIFSSLAIFIACIGLFGLATYSTFQRMKEISIRKVLGATSGNILLLLSKSFLRLILVSMAIAIPVSWWAMHSWLQDFAYRVPLSWWMFVVAGLVTLGIAGSTILTQALKAAVANPVKSLKAE